MQINFPTRDKARKFAAARTANGLPTSVKDNGKDAAKRYTVPVGPRKEKN
jgi:hypothetical protein